MALFALEKFEG